MSEDVIELRKSERFDVQQAFDGAFGSVEVKLANLSLGGVQLVHALALRIGTRGRLTFRRGDVSVSIQGKVVWSHLSQTEDGLQYRTGVQLDSGDVQYAAGLHTLLRAGVLSRDSGSLERKRQRELERAERRTVPGKVPLPPPAP